MRSRPRTLAVIAAAGGLALSASPAGAEPHENAACAAEFGAAVRENQEEGENFGQFVSATATEGGKQGPGPDPSDCVEPANRR